MRRTGVHVVLVVVLPGSLCLQACVGQKPRPSGRLALFSSLPIHAEVMRAVEEEAERRGEKPVGLLETGAVATMWQDLGLRDASLMNLRRSLEDEAGQPLVLVEWGSVDVADHNALLLIDRSEEGRLLYAASWFRGRVLRIERRETEEYSLSAAGMTGIRNLLASATFSGSYDSDVADGAAFFVTYWRQGRCATVASWDLRYSGDFAQAGEDKADFPKTTMSLSELVSRVVTALNKGRQQAGIDRPQAVEN